MSSLLGAVVRDDPCFTLSGTLARAWGNSARTRRRRARGRRLGFRENFLQDLVPDDLRVAQVESRSLIASAAAAATAMRLTARLSFPDPVLEVAEERVEIIYACDARCSACRYDHRLQLTLTGRKAAHSRDLGLRFFALGAGGVKMAARRRDCVVGSNTAAALIDRGPCLALGLRAAASRPGSADSSSASRAACDRDCAVSSSSR